MNEQPKLSEAEWALVVNLLRRELDDLHGEIHHTQTASFRDDLVSRRRMIQELLERLEPVAAQ